MEILGERFPSVKQQAEREENSFKFLLRRASLLRGETHKIGNEQPAPNCIV